MNDRGLGPATARRLWRLNREGLLALRKEPGQPLSNRLAARVISELVDAHLAKRAGTSTCERDGAA